jgi:hypothetical protein
MKRSAEAQQKHAQAEQMFSAKFKKFQEGTGASLSECLSGGWMLPEHVIVVDVSVHGGGIGQLHCIQAARATLRYKEMRRTYEGRR